MSNKYCSRCGNKLKPQNGMITVNTIKLDQANHISFIVNTYSRLTNFRYIRGRGRHISNINLREDVYRIMKLFLENRNTRKRYSLLCPTLPKRKTLKCVETHTHTNTYHKQKIYARTNIRHELFGLDKNLCYLG